MTGARLGVLGVAAALGWSGAGDAAVTPHMADPAHAAGPAPYVYAWELDTGG